MRPVAFTQLLVTVVAFAPLAPAALADVTWDRGAATGNWSDAANWTDDAEPTLADVVTLPSPIPAGGSTITLAAGELAAALIFDQSYTLSGGDLTLGTTGSTLTVAASRTATLNTTLIGDAVLVKDGAGTAALNNANSYTGGTVLLAGQLSIGNGNRLGSGSLTFAGGTLGITSATTLASTTNVIVQASTVSDIRNSQGLSVNGNLSGSGTLNYITTHSTDSKSINLGGDNSGFSDTYNSTDSNGNASSARFAKTIFTAATAGSATARWTFDEAATNYAGAVNFSGGTIHLGSFSGTGRFGKWGGSGTTTLQIGALNLSDTYSGAIDDEGSQVVAINKVGTGTQTFSGANAYEGATTVTAGTLLVNGTHSLAGAYSVGASGTLGGTGTITPAGGNGVTVDGVLAPGASIGTLSFDLTATTGGLTLASGATLSVELDSEGNADQVRLVDYTFGDLVLSNNVINFQLTGGPAPAYRLFTFFAADGTTPVAHGLTNGLLLGTGLEALPGSYLDFSAAGGTAIDLIIPEPGVLMLITAGTALIALRRREPAAAALPHSETTSTV